MDGLKNIATLNAWIARDAISFSPQGVNAALDRVITSLGSSVELLGFGEALHGGEEILQLRNQVFRRLVEAHGYSAIAFESGFVSARLVNDYIGGNRDSYEDIQEVGFGHGFGRLDANRELVEWMRRYNADPGHGGKLRFYGFDMPGTAVGPASLSQVLSVVLEYLAPIDGDGGRERRRRIESLVGADADWEDPAALADPAKAVGMTPAAIELRIETENLMTELRTRGPELIGTGGLERYTDVVHHVVVLRQLLNFHAAIAKKGGYAGILAIRDLMMADNLAHITNRERGRGKVLVYAHNSHLQRGGAVLPWAKWWPAGAHLKQMLGARYAVIGSAIGTSDANDIGKPEAGTLEARLAAPSGATVFIPTHQGRGLPVVETAALPSRSGSKKNPTYIPLRPESFTDYDWLAVLPSVTYSRGGRPLREPSATA